MARLARQGPTRSGDEEDDDEFPDVAALGIRKQLRAREDPNSAQPRLRGQAAAEEPERRATNLRRRKLGPQADNHLLRAWTPGGANDEGDEKHALQEKENSLPRQTRTELRTRARKPAVVIPSSPDDQEDEFVSAQEEVTVVEEVSVMDDDFHSCQSDSSEFKDDGCGSSDDEDEDFFAECPPRRSPAKPGYTAREMKWASLGRAGLGRADGADGVDYGLLGEESETPPWPSRKAPATRPAKRERGDHTMANKLNNALANRLSRLHLDDEEDIPQRTSKPSSEDQEATPPSTPPKSHPGLISPKKLPRIPVTPHRPSSDMFWSQEFVDNWNDEHSPRKQLFPDAMAARQRSPTRPSPEKRTSQKGPAAKSASNREAKKAFEKAKHALAEKFLAELDTTITDGRLAELAASTGGIKLIWTNKLNTTAGRANWKRETIRTTRQPASAAAAAAADGEATAVKHRHHASIELAEKVIDDEHRLLNVLAHEFCHLATFMVTGVATNPHGREFKAWAARCSAAFAARGVRVTTRHSYDIDFKYVWACEACGALYKRHSRSVDPARHRCGSCRGELRQIKPAPRAAASRNAGGGRADDGGEGGAGKKKVTEYQAFVREQMRVVRQENPGSPQKEIMKIVASRWAQRPKPSSSGQGDSVQEVADGLGGLAM